MFVENINKRIINPVWTSSQSHSTCTNMWPVRQQSHSIRYYGPPKSRMSCETDPRIKPEIAPMTMKVDVEQYNKHKSQSSMAFCSTSKVKYMPLHGYLNEAPANLKWSATCSGFFPVISRPTSRPVILHGKRYTILAVDDDRPFICSTTREEDRCSQRTENISDQRRRFNDAERHKFKTRIYKDNTETSQYRIKRNYCLSGHSVSIRSSKETVEERISRLQPMLNLQNIFKKEEPTTHEEGLSDGDPKNSSFDKATPCESAALCDSKKEQSHRNDSNGSVISVDIVSGQKAETESSKLTETIRRVIGDVKKIEIINESVDRAKEWLSELIFSHTDQGQQNGTESQVLDPGTTEDSWTLLLPRESTTYEDTQSWPLFEEHFDIMSSKEVDSSTFVEKIFDDETQGKERVLWYKILELLKRDTVNSSLYLRITKMIASFQNEREVEVLTTSAALGRVCFWVQLFTVLFGMTEESRPDLSSFLSTLIKIIVNRNDLSGDEERCVEEGIVDFANTTLKIANEDVTAETLIDTIPWVFRTYETIFNRAMTLDDLSTSLAMLPIKFDK